MISILVIDDEEHIRRLLYDELYEAGYNVFTHDGKFSNKEELIKYIEEIKPTLIILDISLNVEGWMDRIGLDYLEVIRNKFYDMPIIIYTAYPSFKEDGRILQADYYVEKSFQIKELLDTIKVVLESCQIDFDNLNFGASIAETDIKRGLSSYFIDTKSYKNIIKNGKNIILGNRGVGKSAIIKIIAERMKNQGHLVIELTPDDYSYQIFSDNMVPENQGSWLKQSAYSASWKYLLLVQIMKKLRLIGKKYKSGDAKKIYEYIRDNYSVLDANPIAILISYLKRIESIKIGTLNASVKKSKELQKLYKLEEINNLIPAIKSICKKEKVFILIDDLDNGWDDTEDARCFVGGLVQAALAINQYSNNLRIIISLRQELFDNIPSLFTEAEKIRDGLEKIIWDESSLFELIIKRIKHSVPGLMNYDDQEVWTCVFKDELINGKLKFFNYIINRTLYRPRELIQFCTKILDVFGDKNALPIPYSSIIKAEFEYSHEKLMDISAEYRYQYPGLWSLFDIFRGRKYILSVGELTDIFLAISIGDMRVDDSAKWAIDKDPNEIIEILWKVGFLQAKAVYWGHSPMNNLYYGSHQETHLNIKNITLFRIHPMFHKTLGILVENE